MGSDDGVLERVAVQAPRSAQMMTTAAADDARHGRWRLVPANGERDMLQLSARANEWRNDDRMRRRQRDACAQ